MANPTTSLIATAGLIGGYGTARWTGNRRLGGAVLALAGAGAAYRWRRTVGTGARRPWRGCTWARSADPIRWRSGSGPGRRCSR